MVAMVQDRVGKQQWWKWREEEDVKRAPGRKRHSWGCRLSRRLHSRTVKRALGLCGPSAWVQLPALLPTSCVTLDRLPHLPEFGVFIYKTGMLGVPILEGRCQTL